MADIPVPPEAAVEAAAQKIGNAMITRRSPREIALAVWPVIAAAERRRIGEASFSPDEDDRTGLFRLGRADGVLAERERICRLAIEHHAKCGEAGIVGGRLLRDERPFADLIGDPECPA